MASLHDFEINSWSQIQVVPRIDYDVPQRRSMVVLNNAATSVADSLPTHRLYTFLNLSTLLIC